MHEPVMKSLRNWFDPEDPEVAFKDYNPSKDPDRGEKLKSLSDRDNEEEYLEDVGNWGRPGMALESSVRQALWPITFDYFRQDPDPFSWDHLGRSSGMQFRPDRILSQPVAREWEIRLDQISVNPENEKDVSEFLLMGRLPSKPIREGIIAGGRDYLVIISEPNRRGNPGRLFILNSSGKSGSY